MKKVVLSLLMIAGASVAYSQGTVNFNNNQTDFQTVAPTAANGHNDRLVYYTDNSQLTGTNWFAQLYYASGAGISSGNLINFTSDTPSKFRVSTTSFKGTWSGGTKTFSNVDVGGTATLQVRVWDGSLYSTYAAAADPTSAPAGPHITGESVTFNYTVPAGNAPTTSYYMEGLQSFTLHPAPEPSTIALGLLGAASLLVVRRRK